MLHLVYFSHCPSHIFPSQSFFTCDLFTCCYSLKTYLVKVSKHPDDEEAQGYRSAAPDLGSLCLFARLLALTSIQGHFFSLPPLPRNQGLFRAKIDGWNQSSMVLLFSSST